MRAAIYWLMFVPFAMSCGGAKDDGMAAPPLPAGDDTGINTDGDADADSDDTGEPPVADWCIENGYSVVDFTEAAGGQNYGELAGDFTVDTLDGPWALSENWSGCDVYLFVNYHSEYDYPVQLWNSSASAFLDSSPPNVHYFFMSYESGLEESHVTEISESFDTALLSMSEDEQAHWADRLHYVTTSAWSAGSVGDALSDRGAWAIGIDRNQAFYEVGYLSNISTGSAELRFMTFEARHLNYLVDQAAFIEGLSSDPFVSFDGSAVSSGYATLDLPSAEEMASYDSMYIELELGCGDPYYENCGEWDYLIHAYVCDQPTEDNPYADTACQGSVPEVMGSCWDDEVDTEVPCASDEDCVDPEAESSTATCVGYETAIAADTEECLCSTPDGSETETTYTCRADGSGFDDCACSCGTEIGRWITSYARNGKWIMDASPALAFLKEGGEQSIRFASSYSYENTLTFHLTNEDKGGSPDTVHALFTGGGFNAEYNDKYSPMEVEIPADASRVELYAVISGHGWGAEVENCAEFCNHTHHFTINGTEFVKEHPAAGRAEGCVEQIENGTIPNQFGTWPYGRGGWCAGKQVDPWIVDVTDAVTPGETATITYQGLFEGEDYVPEASGSGSGFGANINMRSHLVISR